MFVRRTKDDDTIMELFNKLGTILGPDGCPKCLELEAQGGGICPDCEETLDLRDSVARRTDRANFVLLQELIARYERGTASTATAIKGAMAIAEVARRGANVLAQQLADPRCTGELKAAGERIHDGLDRLDQSTTALVQALDAEDVPAARHHLETVRHVMNDLAEARIQAANVKAAPQPSVDE